MPLKKVSRNESLIKDIQIDGSKWIKKHLNSFLHCYSRSKYFSEVYELISDILLKNHHSLYDLNTEIIIEISKKIGISANFIKASTLVENSLKKEYNLVEICRKANFSNYISPIKSSTYIEKNTVNIFKLNGININYFEYFPIKYEQMEIRIFYI